MVQIYPSVGLRGATDSTFKEFLKIFPECPPHKPTVFFFFPAQIFLSHIVTNLCLLLLLSRGHSLWLCRLGTALQSNIKFSIIKERKFKNNFRGWRLFSSIRFTSCTFAYI